MWIAGIIVGVVAAAIGVFTVARRGRTNTAIDGGTVSESWLAEQRGLKHDL